jgi:DNA-binding transcriptional LysR family regulator
MSTHLDLRQLRYFVAVADAGHVTRAAERLGIQQPPLSQQIKALEARVGVQLLRRHPKGVALTDTGRVLAEEAQRIVADVERLEGLLTRIAAGREGRLGVGFTSSSAAHRITPQLIRRCRQRHPGIMLDLVEDNAAGLIERIAAGRLNCGLLRVPTARPEGVAFETLLREPVVVALPVGHALLARAGGGRQRTLKVADLRDEALILVRRRGAPGLYENVLALCRAAGFEPRVAHEVERMMTNLNLVSAGAGISVVPQSMRGVYPHAVVYCDLADAAAVDAPLTLAYREGEQGGVLGRFIALAREVARVDAPPGRRNKTS